MQSNNIVNLKEFKRMETDKNGCERMRPADEPVAWRWNTESEHGEPLYTRAQPAQEPIKLDEVEQYRIQMAGISTAAIGYWREGDPIHPDYDTLALRDVAKLYAKYSELYDALDPARQWQEIECPCCGELARAFPPTRTPEWVGLTDEEIETIWKKYKTEFFAIKEVEAKLKEKNA